MKICPFCQTNLTGVPDFGPNNRLCPSKDCGELVTPMIVPDKEEKIELGKDGHPDCFSYYDGRDSACRRCGVREQCDIEFEATRPECYAVHPNEFEECSGCLDASQCVESSKKVLKIKESKMARKKRTRVRRRPAAQPEPEVVVEEEELEEEEEVVESVADGEGDESDLDYTEWSIPDLREELEVRELETKGRKSVLVKRLLADDAELESGGEEIVEPEPEPAPKRKRTRVKDVVKEEAPVVEPEETASVAGVDVSQIVDLVMAQIAQAINAAVAGGPMVIEGAISAPTATAVVEETAAPAKKGLRGQAYEHEVNSPEYTQWYEVDAGGGKPWNIMTPDEKYEFADKHEVEWDEHDDARVDAIRMCKAIYEKLGMSRYKEEYSTPTSRRAVKSG